MKIKRFQCYASRQQRYAKVSDNHGQKEHRKYDGTRMYFAPPVARIVKFENSIEDF